MRQRDGYLNFTCNQLHRMPRFHQGKDERVKHCALFRVQIDRQPLFLSRP